MVAMQELIWEVKPDLIIEAGIAHGGSLIMSASMLTLLDYCDAVATKTTVDPETPKRWVLGIDIDIRSHNRQAIESHPMANRIEMIEGSSIADETVSQVVDFSKRFEKIMVCLDSNHTHEHVLKELLAYAPLVSMGSYCVVFDTIVEDLPADAFPDRPWSHGNNPKTAVGEFLQGNDSFEIQSHIDRKLLISVAPEGYLRRIK